MTTVAKAGSDSQGRLPICRSVPTGGLRQFVQTLYNTL